MALKKRRRNGIRPQAPNYLLPDGKPEALITIFQDVVMYTRYEEYGVRQYPVDPAAIAQSLSQVPQSSGLLLPNTLATGFLFGQQYMIVYVPAHTATLHTPDRSFTIPLPPLVWGGCGSDYRIWALASPEFPTSNQLLCDPPFPNCYADGRICWGSSDSRPPASASSLHSVLKLFLSDSYFNLHVAGGKSSRFPVSVIALWDSLAEAKTEQYPLDDLQLTNYSLAWLANGGPWRGRL